MPKELANSFDEVLSSIQNSPDYQEYLELSKKLKKNEEITNLIQEIKNLQKELVKLEYNKKDTKEIEELYQAKLLELSEYPLYQEFVEKQKKVNEMFQYVKIEIEDFFDKLVDFMVNF